MTYNYKDLSEIINVCPVNLKKPDDTQGYRYAEKFNSFVSIMNNYFIVSLVAYKQKVKGIDFIAGYAEKEKIDFAMDLYSNKIKCNFDIRKALAILKDIAAKNKYYSDHLGGFYEEFALHQGDAQQIGQFFSPLDLATMLENLTQSMAKDIDTPKIYEPCVGSGSLLFAQIQGFHECENISLSEIESDDMDDKSLNIMILNFFLSIFANDAVPPASFRVYKRNALTQKGDLYFSFNTAAIHYVNHLKACESV